MKVFCVVVVCWSHDFSFVVRPLHDNSSVLSRAALFSLSLSSIRFDPRRRQLDWAIGGAAAAIGGGAAGLVAGRGAARRLIGGAAGCSGEEARRRRDPAPRRGPARQRRAGRPPAGGPVCASRREGGRGDLRAAAGLLPAQGMDPPDQLLNPSLDQRHRAYQVTTSGANSLAVLIAHTPAKAWRLDPRWFSRLSRLGCFLSLE
ncbi:hypothetical protein EJB05_54625, partial [Eragrostis curvula]